MLINTSESRIMHFDVNIQGVDFKQLQGSLKFRLEGIEYGFPVSILKDHIEVEVPPLDEIIKKGLRDGESIECQLDVFGEGFYMKPWTGKFDLKCKAIVEAKMSYNEPTQKPDKKIEIVATPIENDDKIINENIEQDNSQISIEENILEGDETTQLIKLLEKLVKKRIKKEDKNEENVNAKKGIIGKKGDRSIVIEPPKDDIKDNKIVPKKEGKSLANKKMKLMNTLVDQFLTGSSKKVIKKKAVIEHKENKKKILKSKLKEYVPKKPGDIIIKEDITKLFESVGMTKESSKKRLIEMAKRIGGDDIEGIYHSLQRIVKPVKSSSSFEDFIRSKSSKE